MGNFLPTKQKFSPTMFYIGDYVIYTKYGMKLNGIIKERLDSDYYVFFQDGGVSDRIVSGKFLKLIQNVPQYYQNVPQYYQNDMPPPYSY